MALPARHRRSSAYPEEDVLRTKADERMRQPEETGSWSRRYKLNLEKLAIKVPELGHRP